MIRRRFAMSRPIVVTRLGLVVITSATLPPRATPRQQHG